MENENCMQFSYGPGKVDGTITTKTKNKKHAQPNPSLTSSLVFRLNFIIELP